MFSLTINKQLNQDHFSAIGTIKFDSGREAEADFLLKKVDDTNVKLVLDSNIKVSKLAGRDVISYTNAKPVPVKNLAPGATVVVENKMWFNLKKQNAQ